MPFFNLYDDIQITQLGAYNDRFQRDMQAPLTGFMPESSRTGLAVSGIDTGNSFDEFAIALPANARGLYLRRKGEAIREELQELCDLWELP